MTTLEDVYDLLSGLNLTRNYRGFNYAAYAVYLTAQDVTRIQLVTKWIYPDVAKHYGVEPSRVERNIRTLVSIIWDQDPNQFSRVTGINLQKKPTNARFIALLADYLRQHNKPLEREAACNM